MKKFETPELEVDLGAKDRFAFQNIYKQNQLIRDFVRTLYTCNKVIAEHEDIGSTISVDPRDHQYEFAGWPLRDIDELADYCRRSLEYKLKSNHKLFLDLATNDTERQIMQACEQMILSGEQIQMTEAEFKLMDKQYVFPRS